MEKGNSVDPDETAHLGLLIWICTVCKTYFWSVDTKGLNHENDNSRQIHFILTIHSNPPLQTQFCYLDTQSQKGGK